MKPPNNSTLILIYSLILTILPSVCLCLSPVSPTWIPNPYFETNPATIKDNILTNFSQMNPITVTFAFTKIYTQIPQLGFGIKNYRASDQLGNQNFAISRTALTQSGFTIYTTIVGSTFVRILKIIYLAVDKSFPYHVNVFSDIDASFPNGILANVTGSFVGTRTYKNTINYTQLAATISSTHNTFGSDLTKCHTALYLSGMHMLGNKTTGQKIQSDITSKVISIDQLEISVVAYSSLQFNLLKFSIVAFDVNDVEKSGAYTVVYYQQQLSALTDQFVPFPSEYATNTLIGIVDFIAPTANHALEFNFQFDLPNNLIKFNQSIVPTQSNAFGGLQSFRISVFYVKTWTCPTTHPLYDIITSMCCQFICGDGTWLIGEQACDDGNKDNNDGCSQFCTIEQNFLCLAADKLPDGRSDCKYQQNITLTMTSIQQMPATNIIHIFFDINPPYLKDWNQTTIQSLIGPIQISELSDPSIIVVPSTNITIQFYPKNTNNQIEVIVSYSQQTVQNPVINFTLTPSNTLIPSIMELPPVEYSLTKNSIVPLVVEENIEKVFPQVIGFVSLLFALLGFLFPVGKLIIIEALAVIQITYFSVLQFNKIPVNLTSLKYLILSSGFSDFNKLEATKNIQSADIYEIMGLQKSFLTNYSINFILFMVPFIIGLTGIILTKLFSKNKDVNSSQIQQNNCNHKQIAVQSPSKEIRQKIVESKTSKDTTQTDRAWGKQFLDKFFQRFILENALYGLLICGYLIWVSVLLSISSNEPANIICIALIVTLWFVYLFLFTKDKSTSISLKNYLNYVECCKLREENMEILTGFGEFSKVYQQITREKTRSISKSPKLYSIFFIERIFCSIIIVQIPQGFTLTSLLIILIYLSLLVCVTLARKLGQTKLTDQEKASESIFIYKNYTLRQTINFITIISIQTLLLTIKIFKSNQGDDFVMTKSRFTTEWLSFLILSLLSLNLLLNAIFWIWQLKCSQIILKTKLIMSILTGKRPQLKQNSIYEDQFEQKFSKLNQNQTKSHCKNFEIALKNQLENMDSEIKGYINSSLLFKKTFSPFDGIKENDYGDQNLSALKSDIKKQILDENKVLGEISFQKLTKMEKSKLFDEI